MDLMQGDRDRVKISFVGGKLNNEVPRLEFSSHSPRAKNVRQNYVVLFKLLLWIPNLCPSRSIDRAAEIDPLSFWPAVDAQKLSVGAFQFACLSLPLLTITHFTYYPTFHTTPALPLPYPHRPLETGGVGRSQIDPYNDGLLGE
jgi:hypothetical protein